MIRLELGYGLLALAGGDAPRLTEQIKGLRRSIAAEMGFVLPPVRIQDNMQLGADALFDPHQGDRGRAAASCGRPCCWRWTRRAARPPWPGERDDASRRSACRRCGSIPSLKEEALFRGCTVVDPPSVLTTHLTEIVRREHGRAAVLRRDAEAAGRAAARAAEAGRRPDPVADHRRAACSACCRRCWPSGSRSATCRRSWRASRRRAAAQSAPSRRSSAHVRARLARQISDSHTGPGGYIPLVTLSPEWEAAFAEALVGPPEDRQLAMAPSKLQEFMQRLRGAFDAAASQRRDAGAADRRAASAATCGPSSSGSGRLPRCWRRRRSSARARIRTVGTI